MNNILTFAVVFSLAAGASAQQAPKKPAAKQKQAPAVAPAKPAAAKAPAATEQPAAAADPAAEMLEKLKAWDAKLETLKADFTQEIHFKEAGLKQSIDGTLRYVKPNLLRIEHIKPSRQIVVTDKKEIWIYKPEDKQAVRTDWNAWRRTQDQNFSGILDFGNYAALEARNNITLSGGKDGAPAVLTFVPRSGKGYSLALTLSAEDQFPVEAEMTVEDTVIKTRLTAVEKNGEADKAIFKFAPPKGTEILEFKN